MRLKIFYLLFALAIATFFFKDQYRNVRDIHPELRREPIQEEISTVDPIVFDKDGFSYTVTPRYSYDIAGLVVSRQMYDQWYSLSRTDTVFPMDLCLIWGMNIENGTYRSRNTKFKQDFRFCLYRYNNGYIVHNNALSNNHLVIKGDDVEKLAESIRRGDQVRIVGYLADVNAKPLNNVERYEPENLIWPTSISRDDSGAGACETVYVEKIEILRRANPWAIFIFSASLWGMIFLIFHFFFEVLREAYRSKVVKLK